MDKEECLAVSKQLDKLQNIIISKIDTIKELCKKYKLKTSITIVIEMEAGNGPELVLTENNISFLFSINSEIGFDMYID